MGTSRFGEQLIVFTRYPVPGETKTRLIPALGSRGAADLQRRLTEHTLRQAVEYKDESSVQLEVRYSGSSKELVGQWLSAEHLLPQGKGPLGDRLARAFNSAFARGLYKVVVIGADCPNLSPPILADAFKRLDAFDLVLGPAADGGYYLIGLRRPASFLFRDIPWGSAGVLSETIHRAASFSLSVSLLEVLADVDRPEDLKHFRHHSHPQ